MRKLDKSELKRVYGGFHKAGPDQGNGTSNGPSVTASAPDTLTVGS